MVRWLLVQPECDFARARSTIKILNDIVSDEKQPFVFHTSDSYFGFSRSLRYIERQCKKSGERFSCFDVLFDVINTSFENCSSCSLLQSLFLFSHTLPVWAWARCSLLSQAVATIRRDARGKNFVLESRSDLICFCCMLLNCICLLTDLQWKKNHLFNQKPFIMPVKWSL